MSPDVDVEIGGGEEQSVEQEGTESDVKQPIDDRLRWIQMEDNMPGVSKREDGQTEEIEYTTSDSKKENKDEKVKENRLALLTVLKKRYEHLTDFSKL